MRFQLEIADRLRTVDVQPASAADWPLPPSLKLRRGLAEARTESRWSAGGRHASSYQVIVDGHLRFVEAVRVDSEAWSLILHDPTRSEARSVEAIVVPRMAENGGDQRGNGALDVHIDGYRIPVHLRNGRRRPLRDRTDSLGTGPERVTAPMPGKVIRVLVRAGEEVTARQALVVVEAMKMENELRASREGRILSVLVREGQSVEAGSALVVVE